MGQNLAECIPIYFSHESRKRKPLSEEFNFKTMKMSASELCKVLKEGELEKRSDNLLQFWKRKTCVLTEDSLNIYADSQKKSKSKELKLQSIKKVDCVERTGKFVYFTIVTTDIYLHHLCMKHTPLTELLELTSYENEKNQYLVA
ncbi:hypothetical protein JZ751_020842 [Albula glossodonta]|uniref:Pleckstrin homology-like domain family A member 2 n=1 Tax=Albula glossodonta TaxID=121402 RepID=A0A8T2PNI2_9TELE|nr:hypothetical protein JZ751_020842 [Albula glossodonta]